MIGRKIIIQFLSTLIFSLITFLTLSLITRFFGAENWGNINYYLGLLGLIFLFSDFGFSRAHIRFVANGRKIREKIGVFLAIKFFLETIGVVAALIYYFLFLPKINNSYFNLVFIILLANEFFSDLGTSLLLTFEGLQRPIIENLVLVTGKIGKLLILFFLLSRARSITSLASAYLTEGMIVFIAALILMRRFWPFSWNKKIFKEYWRYSLPFFLIFPLSYVQGNIDVVILRHFWTAAVVGYYAAAINLTGFLKSLYGALITLFFPKMAQLFSEKKIDKIKDYTDMAVKYLLIIFIPLLLFLYIFRQEFIIFFLGKKFAPAIDIFSLSLLSIFILMITSPYDYILYATNKHQKLAWLTLFSVVLAVLLQLILVPQRILSIPMGGLGGKGVVLANTMAWFIAAVYKIHLVNKYFGIKINHNVFSLIIFMLFTILIFSLFFEKQIFIYKIIYLIISLATFILFSRKFGMISSADIKYVKLILQQKNRS